MNVSVLVASFGNDAWCRDGDHAAESAVDQADEVIRVHEPGTLAEVRNLAAERASCEWLCFLDADDQLADGYIDAMRRAEPAFEALLAPAVNFRPHVRSRRVIGRADIPPRRPLVDGNYLVIGSLVRRRLFAQVGGFREFDLYEDWDLWQRCELAGATVVEVPDAVYLARMRPRSRNRGHSRATKLAAHHAIRSANYPELYR